jgi:hypothetical protein
MEDERREDDNEGWLEFTLELIGGVLELLGELGS